MRSFHSNTELSQEVDAWNLAYERGDESWFNYFDSSASVYTISATEPFLGRAAYEDNFKSLLKEPREVEILKRDSHVMGDTAIVMELQRVTQSQVVTVMRQSTMWKRQDGAWKIVHFHTAAPVDPKPVDLPNDPQSIRVLHERMPTVSAQAGVAL